jgi:hypothetical protein
MFKEYLAEKLSVGYENKLLIFDLDSLMERYDYRKILSEHGFKCFDYNDAEYFRFIYEDKIRHSNDKSAVIVVSEIYVPYDIRKSFYNINLSFSTLFTKLNSKVLAENKSLDLELLYIAYSNNFSKTLNEEQTETFINNNCFYKENVLKYISHIKTQIDDLLDSDLPSHIKWLQIARKKGSTEFLAAKCGVSVDFANLDAEFNKFILNEYKNLSGMTSNNSPVMVNSVMDYIAGRSNKFAIVVLDGMSNFDWSVLSKSFGNIKYSEDYIYAMIPTTTAISRQCLFSGKLPCRTKKSV